MYFFTSNWHLFSDQGSEVTASNAEERNTFALSVLRRIKMKLDGREPDVLRKATVAEQVDFIIREATNVVSFFLIVIQRFAINSSY